MILHDCLLLYLRSMPICKSWKRESASRWQKRRITWDHTRALAGYLPRKTLRFGKSNPSRVPRLSMWFHVFWFWHQKMQKGRVIIEYQWVSCFFFMRMKVSAKWHIVRDRTGWVAGWLDGLGMCTRDLQQPGFRNRSSMLFGFTVDIRCLYSTACTKLLLQAWKCMTLCLLRKLPRTSVEILGAGTRQCFSMLFSFFLFFEVSASSARLGWKSIINTVLNHM